MNATERAFEIFKELETGTSLVSLDGFDSDITAVVSNGGITLVQSYSEDLHQEIFLPEECHKQLIKILQEKVNDN